MSEEQDIFFEEYDGDKPYYMCPPCIHISCKKCSKKRSKAKIKALWAGGNSCPDFETVETKPMKHSAEDYGLKSSCMRVGRVSI